ncbi:MAG: hypothetical protein JWM89_4051 [Acidimicrobiales bacterium]|nr:hypothetical protein [Acidimicrobiales bacterium]
MVDRTRLPRPGLDGAGVFAQFIEDWLECHESLLDAAGSLRLDGSESVALEALLATRAVLQLSVSWRLWEEWTGSSAAAVDRRLAVHLGEERLAWFRFAVWG